MWHSQFISRGASYSWWRLTLGDFKGSQIWKILTHQREKNLTEIFSPVLCCWWSEGPEGFTMAGERGATLGGQGLWENPWTHCFRIWLIEEAKRSHPSLDSELCVWSWANHLPLLGLHVPIWDGGFAKEKVGVLESNRSGLEPWFYHLLTAGLSSSPTCTYVSLSIKLQ